MLLKPKEQLVEVVRLLESEQYVFKNDPVPITKSLKASNLPMHERIISRATRIDASQKIAQTIAKVDARLKFILFAMGVVWIILGFLGLVALMQSTAVNFFYVLVSLLGLHTLMLVLWVLFQLKGHVKKSPSGNFLFSPSFLIRKSDPITQAAVQLYTQQLQHKGMRWYVGKISHQLWLATLTGMLFAILFLLVVRQYNFSWQSTLLTSDTLVSIVGVLAWLPNMLGFSVPSAPDVVNSQLLSQATDSQMSANLARKWAGLLIGSVLCYGFMPRIIAWVVCAVMFTRQKLTLSLQAPYYQHIINQWSATVVDANDMKPEIIQKAPEAKLSKSNHIQRLACLLETPWQDDANNSWLDHVLDADWQLFTHNNGLLDSRDDIAILLTHLQNEPVQLLVGIRGEALPDRGMMRKLDKLATHAKGGVVVKLLSKTPIETVRTQQWHAALAERNIGLVAS